MLVSCKVDRADLCIRSTGINAGQTVGVFFQHHLGKLLFAQILSVLIAHVHKGDNDHIRALALTGNHIICEAGCFQRGNEPLLRSFLLLAKRNAAQLGKL